MIPRFSNQLRLGVIVPRFGLRSRKETLTESVTFAGGINFFQQAFEHPMKIDQNSINLYLYRWSLCVLLCLSIKSAEES